MNNQTLSFRTHQHGFTLIEVLVALLVLSIGLLGLAALQASALKTNHGAYNRGQATFLAVDIIERMRANRQQAIALAYDRDFDDAIPGGGSTANTDLNEWLTNSVVAILPDGKAAIDCTIPAPVANSGLCRVTIQWDESRLGGNASDGGNTTQFSFVTNI